MAICNAGPRQQERISQPAVFLLGVREQAGMIPGKTTFALQDPNFQKDRSMERALNSLPSYQLTGFIECPGGGLEPPTRGFSVLCSTD